MATYNAAAGDTGIVEAVEPSDDDKKAADEFKKQGNDAMKGKEYKEAIEKYGEAIKKDPTNEMYYCNRAAAYTNIDKFHEALDDCKKAISINENYAKAFSRMALIYSKLQFYDESVACYKTAIELEPDNDSYKQNLTKVEAKATQQREEMAKMNPAMMDPAMQQQAALAGMQQGMGAMGGMPPGMPGMPAGEMPPGMMEAYQQFAQNPEFSKMAESVMSNPEMKGMVDSFMKNAGVEKPAEGAVNPDGKPVDPMEAMGQAMMGQGADVSQLMALGQQFAAHMQKENPELIENLRSQMGGMAPPSSGSLGDAEKKE